MGELPENPTMTDLVRHRYDTGAFGSADDPESRGRAAGWREAIAALRDHIEANYHPASIDGARLRKIAAELESLAPKETP